MRWLGDETDARVSVMGILNLTPDSFSDGGAFGSSSAALAHAENMVAAGADIVDVGAESTRPGAPAVSADEQLRRIGTVVEDLARRGVVCSIDTTDPVVAVRALEMGARIVNSVSLDAAPSLARVARAHDARLVLMHCRGSMTAMRGFSDYPETGYRDVVAEVAAEWSAARDAAIAEGLPREHVAFDPGLGFAKSADQSTELCSRLGELARLGAAIVVGPSRKSFLAAKTAVNGVTASPTDRLGATIAAVLACVRGGAQVVRVHDVAPIAQALRMERALDAARQAREAERRAGAPNTLPGGAP